MRLTKDASPSDRLINLFGALAQGVSDEMRGAISQRFPAGGKTAAAFGKALRLSHAGAARVVERLVAQKFVSKSQSAGDRRVMHVSLTPGGETERRALLNLRSTAITGLLAAVGEKDRAALERVAETILASLPRDEVRARTTCRFCDEEKCTDCPTDIVGHGSAN
jgi:DNA-binding MarR family transcriptional regulator